MLTINLLIYFGFVNLQMEGPMSPAEIVEILQRTMEEQGSAFGGARAEEEKARAIVRAKEEEKIKADRQLREEQDAAYLAALKIDKVCALYHNQCFKLQFIIVIYFSFAQEKEKLKQLSSGGKDPNPVEVASNKANYVKLSDTPMQKHNSKAKISPSTIRETQYKQTTNGGKDSQVTQVQFIICNHISFS